MPVYTVTAVSDQVRDVNLDHGAFRSYKLHLRDQHGALLQSVEWLRKASSPAPQQGETVEGEITQGQYGPKFKAAQKAFGGGGGRGRDPQERAEIRRQNAQAQALRWFELLSTRGELKTPSLLQLQEAINWFFADSGSARS